VLEWQVGIEHTWSLKAGDHGKGLKRVLEPELWRELELTYAGPEIDANWEALFATIALFRSVAAGVGRHFSYDYPYGLERRVVAHLRRVQERRPRTRRR
jgi:aminoglycoside 6-adenylyltransferase